jgi:PD-(D/E)XK nuclease superfamily
VFVEEWSTAIADAESRDDENADELAASGLVAAYPTEDAGPLQPNAVEQTVQGEIAGMKVRGIVDLLDPDGRVLDFETASKRPNGVAADHSLQLTTYAMITPACVAWTPLPKPRRYRWCSRVIRLVLKTGTLPKLCIPWFRSPTGTGFIHRIAAVPCAHAVTAATGASASASSADAYPSKCAPVPHYRFPVSFSISPNDS